MTPQNHPMNEQNLWLPPRRLRRYQWAKMAGGLLLTATFSSWMILQGVNTAMGWAAGFLIGVTVWVVIKSTLDDHRRGRGRQIEIVDGRLLVTTPDRVTRANLADVTDAQWRSDNQPGLWLYNQSGQTLAHLDRDFLMDQAEARSFLGWARKRVNMPFGVRWP